MRLLIINNVPTPYRTFLFGKMHEVGAAYGVAVTVGYQAEREARRAWRPEEFGARFPHFVSRGANPWRREPKRFFTHTTLNTDLLGHVASGRYTWVLMSAYMSVTNWIASVLPADGTMRLLWSESNVYSTRRMGWPARLFKQALLPRYDVLVCPGRRAVEYLARIRPAIRRLPVIWLPNLVDVSRFQRHVNRLRADRDAIRAELDLKPGDLVLLGVGQMKETKGYGRLIEAARLVRDDFRMVLLGDGPLRRQWIEAVRRANLQDRVRLPGQADEETVLRHLAIADWFVHPALSDPSPLVAIEAVNAGLPVAISRQTGNAPETVEHEVNGYTFDASDAGQMRACLERVIRTPPAQRAGFAAASRRISHERFDPDVVVHRFYRELLRLTGKRRTVARTRPGP